ncbi:MAG: hypothetical protein ACYC6N_00565 [Pirellulaceae bacterium]
MEPFSISILCTTCQARLRVRDSAAIGQILACPKCGSMVMVEAPAGHDPAVPTKKVPDNGAVCDTPTISATPAPPIASDPPTSLDPPRPQRTFKFREDFVPPAEPTATKDPRGPKIKIPDPPRAAGWTAPVTPPEPEAGSAPPDGAGVPQRHAMKQWLLLGGAALVGILLALAVVGILASGRSGAPLAPPSLAEASTTGENRLPKASSSGPTVPAVAGEMTPRHGAGSDGASSATSPSDATAGANVNAVDVPQTSPPSQDAAQTPEAATSGNDEVETPPGGTAAADPADQNTASPTSSDTVPAGDGAGDAATPSEEPKPSSAIPPGDMLALDPQLSLPIAGIEFEGLSLIDFAEFVADFTALSVTLDLASMQVAQISPDTKLDLQQRGVSVGQMLQAAIEPAGLTFVAEDGQIVITPRADVNQELQLQTYDVSDLANGDPQTQALAHQIATLILPHSWSEAGGPATLSISEQSLEIEQTAAGHFQLTRFLDRLRSVRGLLPRSELPDELLELTPAFARAGSALNTPISVNFSEPTEVARILEQLRAETDVRLLVDWPATRQANWQPTTLSTLSGTSRSLAALLSGWLEPLQLGYRVTDVQTVQITSQESLTVHADLEIYPLKVDVEKEGGPLIDELKQHIGESEFVEGGGIGVVLLDLESRSLLTLLPQPQQRRLYQWLTSADKLRVTTAARSP